MERRINGIVKWLAAGVVAAATCGLISGCATSQGSGGAQAVYRAGCPSSAAPADQQARSQRPLTVTFFGASTLLFDDTRDQVLIDGYFTRPKKFATVLLPLESRTGEVDRGLGPPGGRLGAVLVAHAHHDHALDLAVIADRRRDAAIVGTPSVTALAAAQGVAVGRLCTAAGSDSYQVGDFAIRPRYSPHGPSFPVIGAIIDRDIGRAPDGAAHFLRFRDDLNLSFEIDHGSRKLLVQPSTGANGPDASGRDVVFLGIGRLSAMSEKEARTYLEDSVPQHVRLVVPIHWDDFTTELDTPLDDAPWFLDDTREGFARLCEVLGGRSGLEIQRPDSRARVVFAADGSWRLRGSWTRQCLGRSPAAGAAGPALP